MSIYEVEITFQIEQPCLFEGGGCFIGFRVSPGGHYAHLLLSARVLNLGELL